VVWEIEIWAPESRLAAMVADEGCWFSDLDLRGKIELLLFGVSTQLQSLAAVIFG
jgi:hypothetical protein